MKELQRRWSRFVAAAVLAIVMAGLAIGGWAMYGVTQRAYQGAEVELANTRSSLTTALGDRADAESKATAAEAEATEIQRGKSEVEGRLAAAQQQFEADRAKADLTLQEIEAKLSDAIRTRQETEIKLTAAEQSRQELEGKLAGSEQTVASLQAKLADAGQARMLAEARATGAEKEVSLYKEHADRLTEDLKRYSKDLASAREAEWRTSQRLDRALAAGTAGLAPQPSTSPPSPWVNPLPLDPAAQAEASTAATPATQPTDVMPAAVVISPQGSFPRAEDAQAETQGLAVAAATPAPLPLPSPEAVAAVSPAQDAPWFEFLKAGEDQVVQGDPAIGVELIRQAMDKSGSETDYRKSCLKSMGWGLLRAGRIEEAQPVLEEVIDGLDDWSSPPLEANPDQWTAAFLLGKVTARDYARRWEDDPRYGSQLECLPWFYIGQKREIEGHQRDALAAYRVCMELGRRSNSYPIHNWAAQRAALLEPPTTTQPTE